MEIPKNILYLVIIILAFIILSRTLYLNSIKTTNTIENFISSNNNSNIRSIVNKVQDLGTTSNSKYNWSNALMNINSTTIKPISFWHPNPPVGYVKLGDMISTDPKFKAPSEKAVFVNGEIKKPVDYIKLVDIGVPIESSNIANYISNKTYLDDAINKLTTIGNVVASYNGLITGLKTRFLNKMKENYYKSNYLQIIRHNTINNSTSSILNQNLFNLLPQNFIYDKNSPIKNASLLNLGRYEQGVKYVVNIPANYRIGLLRNNIENNSLKFSTDYVIPNIDIINLDLSKENETDKKKEIFNRYLKLLSDEQFLVFTNINNKFEYNRKLKEDDIKFNKNNIVNLFEILSEEEIYSGINITKEQINDFINNFPDIKFKNNIKNDLLNFLKDLGNLINSFAINYVSTNVSLEFNFSDLFQDYLKYNYSFIIYEYDFTNLENSIKSINPDQFNIKLNEKIRHNIDFSFTNKNYELIQNFLDKVSSLKVIRDNINNNKEILPPLRIFKPIPPPGYKVLGHIFGDNMEDVSELLKSIDFNKTVACIPEHCVKDVRPWQKTDMVFEYSRDNVYFAIYYNPICGTFNCVKNRNELPEGKIYKIVACVEKCKVVDELIKSDECARNFLNKNKTIISNTPMESSNTADIEDTYYVDKITEKSKQITRLENKARQLQLLNDKADIINRERNKDRLQTYVDDQRRNINSIVDKLKTDKNKVDINVDISVERLNRLIREIQASSLSQNQKSRIIDSILGNKNLKDSGMMSDDEFNKKLNKIIASCPSIDLSGLVKKSVVADVCYGCDNP